jgi:radical SAM protein with 4Fe4S-binding SPASM domain
MFCPAPFNTFQIKPNGDVHLCCEDWLPTPVGNLLKSDPLAIWNSSIALDIRRSIIDGSFSHCTHCPYLPGPGGPIERKGYQIPNRILVVGLDYDKTCNLACPSCRRSHVHNPAGSGQVALVHDAFLRSGILNLANRLHVSGAGDPFASPTYFNLLQNLEHIEHSPNLVVGLMTNGQLLDAEHWEALGPTRDLVRKIGISVDAGTEHTYYLNRGGSWKRLWDNIEFTRGLKASLKIEMHAYFTIQANNYRELASFTVLALDRGFDDVSVFYLRNWDTFTTTEYKQRAAHLPEHPEYAHFRAAMTNPQLTRDPRIFLPTFPARVTT